jgi:hypothetical protein
MSTQSSAPRSRKAHATSRSIGSVLDHGLGMELGDVLIAPGEVGDIGGELPRHRRGFGATEPAGPWMRRRR